jgi:hypothetical protein
MAYTFSSSELSAIGAAYNAALLDSTKWADV